MNNPRSHIAIVFTSVVLFLSASLMHEYGWMIPDNPVSTMDTVNAPIAEIVEETQSEEAIDYYEALSREAILKGESLSYIVLPFTQFEGQVLSPPPDFVV